MLLFKTVVKLGGTAIFHLIWYNWSPAGLGVLTGPTGLEHCGGLGQDRLRCFRFFINLQKQLPDVNFINILRTAFALVDPKSVKNTVKLPVFFAL